MPAHLILRLEAPLAAFGGAAIDNYGVTRDFPAVSMLTGLLANALGWYRREVNKLQSLQDRLVFAARRDRETEAGFLTDMQNARLHQKDQGWTTFGFPEGRETSPSYKGVDAESPVKGKYLLQRRQRDYQPDLAMIIALRLEPPEQAPTLDTLEKALDRPARPLFIGRKPCLPSAPLLAAERATRWIDAATVFEALQFVPAIGEHEGPLRTQWPVGEGGEDTADRQIALCDQRNWHTGLHGGTRLVAQGRMTPPGLEAPSS